MKFGLSISRLSRGGSERQLMCLARGLKARGHQVEVMCYGGGSDLDEELERTGIPVRTGDRDGWVPKYQTFRRWLVEFQPDVVHGFMKRASTLALMTREMACRTAVLGSDFSTASFKPNALELRAALIGFYWAEGVVTQTVMNKRNLERLAPWLRGKVFVVRNGLDFGDFEPRPAPLPEDPFVFCSVGTVYNIKNPLVLVRAANLLRQQSTRAFRVDWYGRLGLQGDDHPSPIYQEACRMVNELGLQEFVRFHGEVDQVQDCYRGAHALVHPSVQEGFPNAVVEAMACGLPIIVSNVSDMPLAVEHARNGSVFEVNEPAQLAANMQAMMDASPEVRRDMGLRSRELAHKWFGLDRFLDEYEEIYHSIHERRIG